MSKKYGLTPREYEIMEFMWSSSDRVTYKELINHFSEKVGMKKQTLSTFLKKLIDDGLISADMSKKKFLYSPALSREEHIHQWTNAIVKDCFNSSLGKFITAFAGEKLRDNEVKELKNYLAQYEEDK